MALSDEQPMNTNMLVGTYYDWVNNRKVPTGTEYKVLHERSGGQISQGHKKDRDGKYRRGGYWFMVRSSTIHGTGSTSVHRYSYKVPVYEGHLWTSHLAGGTNMPGPPLDWTSTSAAASALTARGAEAWNRLRPDQPDFSFATSVYEMKDFAPVARDALKGIMKKVIGYKPTKKYGGGSQSKKRKKSELSKSGQFYLAAQFGYIPLLRDIQNYVKAQKNAQKRLDQLYRDAGKPVRRRTTLKNSASENASYGLQSGYTGGSTALNFLQPTFVTQCYVDTKSSGKTTRYVRNVRTWAEGSFAYMLPPGPRNVVWTRKMMRRIMGKRVTPADLYQVMPWSWLNDYFTTLGEVIKAVSPGVADRLYCNYAYIMQTKEWTTTTVATTTIAANGAKAGEGYQTHQVSASMTTQHISKCRVAASPFGWGLKQSDLNGSQLAILGALGLSRLP